MARKAQGEDTRPADGLKFFAKVWNKDRIPSRVKLAHAAGLDGRRGGAGWGKPKDGENPNSFLTEAEQQALTDIIWELSARYQKRRAGIIKKTSVKLGVSKDYLESSPKWIQEGRAPTEEEYRDWARRPVW